MIGFVMPKLNALGATRQQVEAAVPHAGVGVR
jgi:hypothetical protein